MHEMIVFYRWPSSCSKCKRRGRPRFRVQPQEFLRMSRPLSRLRTAGALSLLAGLALLPGCSTKGSDDDGAGNVSRIVYAVRQHTVVNADGSVSIDVAG